MVHARGGRSVALTLTGVALLVCAPLVVAEPWAQAGHDAARTRVSADDGPVWGNVAWKVHVPGSRAFIAAPLIIGASVYVLTSDQGFEGLDHDAVFRLDAATGETQAMAQLDSFPLTFGADASSLYVNREGATDGLALGTLEKRWSWEHPEIVADPSMHICDSPVVAAETVYVLCGQAGSNPFPTDIEQTPADDYPRYAIFVAALDASSGEVLWTWVKGAAQEVGGTLFPNDPVERSSSVVTLGHGLSQIGPYVFVPTIEANSRAGFLETHVWALDAASGELVWSLNTSRPETAIEFLTTPYGASNPPPTPPTGTSTQVFLFLDELLAVNPGAVDALGRPRILWRLEADQTDAFTDDKGRNLAFDGTYLYATSSQTLLQIDAQTQNVVWAYTIPIETGELWGPGTFVVADDVLYMRTARPSGEINVTGIWAVRAGDQAPLWTYTHRDETLYGPTLYGQERVTPRIIEFGLGEGLLVFATRDGTVGALGHTTASPDPRAVVSTQYPGVDDPVTVDLSGAEAGAQGPPSSYRVDWGDGDVSEWTDDPIFRHIYEQAGDVTARAYVMNDAGQTASQAIVVHVGTPPPNFLETAFAGENQGRTLGILGLALGVLVGIFAVVRLRRLEHTVRTAVTETNVPDEIAPGGIVLGRYELGEPIGEGGQGVTYLARDTALDRPVVVKVLHGGRARTRVMREARAMGALRHPNVVTIHDVGQVEGQICIVMEHVDSGSLAERLEQGPLDRSTFRDVAIDLLRALEAVHDAGLVHRDVKPSNVLITRDGWAKLADFGVARPAESGSTMTDVFSGPIGTVQYMAPEQARGHKASTATDLYAAAATLYEAYTGRPLVSPSIGESQVELQQRIAASKGFEAPLKGPRALKQWFAKALEADEQDRFASAHDMREALEAALS